MNIATKDTVEYELTQGVLSVSCDPQGYTLTFRRQNDVWIGRNIKQFLVNSYYFTFYDEFGALYYFLPSILMKAELIGISFLQKYYLKKNPAEKDEMILSTFSYEHESAYITRQYTYSIIYNDDFLLLGMDGYRKIIARKNISTNEEVTISKTNLFETEMIAPQTLLHKPLKNDLFLTRAYGILGENLYQFPEI